jgi:tRNA-dihydrouridine synthase 1
LGFSTAFSWTFVMMMTNQSTAAATARALFVPRLLPISKRRAVATRRTTNISLHHLDWRSSTHIVTTISHASVLTRSSSSSSAMEQQQQRVAGLILPSCNNNKKMHVQTVIAPMVAASDYAFRCLVRQYSHVDLVYTQMLHARQLIEDGKSGHAFRQNHLDIYEYSTTNERSLVPLLPCQLDFLEGLDQEEQQQAIVLPGEWQRYTTGPVVVQLAGNDVDTVVAAAQLVYEHTNGQVAGIDLNCGCPQGIARKGRYGAFLMERQPERVIEILTALREHLPRQIAVSCKMRLPLSDDLLYTRIPQLLDTGIDFLTIHARTIHENKTLVRASNTNRLKLVIDIAQQHHRQKQMLKQQLQGSSGSPITDLVFPIIANGGIETFDDVERVRQATGAVAAMSSEALLENPGLFAGSISSSSLSWRRSFQMARDYLKWCAVYPPLPGVMGSVGPIVRGHLFKMLHSFLNEQHDLRFELASNQGRRNSSLQGLQALVEELYSRYNALSEQELEQRPCCSSNPQERREVSWYRRHWKANEIMESRRSGATTTTNITRNSSSPTSETSPVLSIDDRKRILQERIATLRFQKEQRQQQQRVTVP